MHPHNLARAVTDVAYNGTPVTRFVIVAHFEYAEPQRIIYWGQCDKVALRIGHAMFPCAEWVVVDWDA